MDFNTIISWMGAIGIPTIFTMTAWCVKRCVGFSKRLKILMEAQQAQMRRDLLNDYHMYMQQGWISDDDMQAWDNAWDKYHNLGVNGVLTARREELLKLPNRINTL